KANALPCLHPQLLAMVSYKRLSPEEVHFSGAPLLEPPPDDSGNSAVRAEDPELPLLARRPQCSSTTTRGQGGGTQQPEACSLIAEAWRFDCYPERGVVVTEEMCHARNCCFVHDSKARPPGQNGVPYCFYPPDFPSYELVAINDVEMGYTGKLIRTQKTYYPKDIETLQFDVLYESNNRLISVFQITDPANERYEVPIDVPVVKTRAPNPMYTVEFIKKPFGLIVKRKQNGAVLLNTTVAPLFYADQFLQMSTSLPSTFVYGLGEHRSNLLHDVQWNTLTMWARDAAPELTNLYGAHPFSLLMESDGLAHGLFLLNSNAMDVVLQPAPALTWRTVGGILDLYVFLGPDPASVIGEYLEVIGKPAMPVYWALGYHLCRWGYDSSNKTWEVVKEMRNYGIPQDVQWNDIDYMDNALDFTYNPVNFSTLPNLVNDLHINNQHYVMILDPGISSTQPAGSYWPFDEGIRKDIFINNSSGDLLIGKVWPGLTAFPDFSNPDTHEWWYQNLQKFHSKVPFDGLWIDMNEPSNFFDGSVNGCPENELETPPYTPGVLGGTLRAKTVCASAQHKTTSHYNVHSLYGLMEAKASARYLRILGKRPFVISRSTFPSQGLYSGHWLGDNRSRWKDLYMSIPGMLTFNLLGIPLVGADICGFSDNSTEELCVRWTQLGTFYPLSRNHNTKESQAQDPTMFSPAARAAMKEALLLRYSLFPFLYTLFHHAHLNGHTVARPLFFEFPLDNKTYSIDKQFLWGKSLLVTPVLEPGVDYVVGYLPKGVWYDFYTVSCVSYISAITHTNIVYCFLKGCVFALQRPNTTLWVSSGQPLHLITCLSEEGLAEGDLFWDDRDSLDTYETGHYAYITFKLRKVLKLKSSAETR
uniref:P-type domain-containing protein n=1 Tax=Electrophorus electricus TaxID=8005 RepID=A0A4W4FQF6_ELEEL